MKGEHEAGPIDRRKVRTRQLLRDALMKLVLEKGYDALTVQDITDEANLGRATFYLHYDDKEDLLMSSLRETVDKLLETIRPPAGKIVEDNLPGRTNNGENEIPPIVFAFQHAADNRDLYRVMLGGQGSRGLVSELKNYIAGIIQQGIEARLPLDQLPFPVEILAQHSAGSLISLLTWWVENNMPYSPEYMAQAFFNLNTKVLLDHIFADPALRGTNRQPPPHTQ